MFRSGHMSLKKNAPFQGLRSTGEASSMGKRCPWIIPKYQSSDVSRHCCNYACTSCHPHFDEPGIPPYPFEYCTPSQWRAAERGIQPEARLMPGIFAFLSLPGELREMIYRELLVTDIPLQLVQRRPCWPDILDPGKQIDPTILRLNKQTYREASTILYGENTWYINIEKRGEDFRRDAKEHHSDSLLGPPLKTQMSQIQSVVMFPTFEEYMLPTIRRGLHAIGIDMSSLRLFALSCEDEVIDKIAYENRHCVVECQQAEIVKRFVWFPNDMFAHRRWLVRKNSNVVSVEDPKGKESIAAYGSRGWSGQLAMSSDG